MTQQDSEKVIDYEPSSKKSGCRKCWLVNSIFLLVTWAAIAGTWVYFSQKLPVVSDLGQRIDNIETELKEVGLSIVRTPAKISGLPPELPADSSPENVINGGDLVKHSDLDTVEERIRTVEERLKAINNLEREVQEVKEIAIRVKQSASGPLVMALVQVQKQIQRGQPFDKELELITNQAKSDPVIMESVGILKSHGEKGIPTIEELRDQFSKLAGAVVAAARTSGGVDFWSRAENKLLSMFSIRNINNDSGGSTEAIVVRAEKALKNYNVTEAVMELDGLEEKSRGVLTEWMAKASARVAVEYAIERIYNRITKDAVENKG